MYRGNKNPMQTNNHFGLKNIGADAPPQMASEIPTIQYEPIVWYRTWSGFFLILWLALLTGLAAVGFGAGVDWLVEKDGIGGGGATIFSNFVAMFPMALIPTSDNFAYATCGNFTVTEQETEFNGDTLIGYLCGEPLDTCNINVCSDVDGACHEQLGENSTCSSSFPCPAGQTCNIETCMCESDTTNQCTVDDDCLRLMDNSVCQEVTCVGGQCVRDTAFGQQCSTNAECPSTTYCNSLCACVNPLPVGVVYIPATGPAFANSDAFDFSNPIGTSDFVYTQFQNYVEINFRISFTANDTALNEIQSSWFFTSPLGLPPNPAGFCTGFSSFFPSVALPQGLETTVTYGNQGFGCNYGGTNDRFVLGAINLNGFFVGPLTVFTYEFWGTIRYEPLIV